DIQHPVQAVLDGPMAANGLGCADSRKRGGRDVVSGLEAAAVLQFGPRGDPNDRCDIRQANFAGEAAIAIEPANVVGDGYSSLLDAAVAFVDIHRVLETGSGSVG